MCKRKLQVTESWAGPGNEARNEANHCLCYEKLYQKDIFAS